MRRITDLLTRCHINYNRSREWVRNVLRDQFNFIPIDASDRATGLIYDIVRLQASFHFNIPVFLQRPDRSERPFTEDELLDEIDHLRRELEREIGYHPHHPHHPHRLHHQRR
jgi:hypothetical protein